MKVGIFYITHKASFEHQAITTPSGKQVYIRVVEVEARDEGEALDVAQPRAGESVMNAHRLDSK